MLADVMWRRMSSSCPIVYAPKPSPKSLFRSTCTTIFLLPIRFDVGVKRSIADRFQNVFVLFLRYRVKPDVVSGLQQYRRVPIRGIQFQRGAADGLPPPTAPPPTNPPLF